MATDIELIIAPGKYYYELKMEGIEASNHYGRTINLTKNFRQNNQRELNKKPYHNMQKK